MYREVLPRLYELKDLSEAQSIDDKKSYFYQFEKIISNSPLALKFYKKRELELSMLDSVSWNNLMKDVLPAVTAFDESRHWQQFIDRLNEVKGYVYLKSIGCTGIEFISRSKIKGEETPDLKAALDEKDVYCEIKTINISENEIEERKKIKMRRANYNLPSGFYKKLDLVISKAKSQLKKNSNLNILYLIINFDEISYEPQEKFVYDINNYIEKNHGNNDNLIIIYE